MQKKRNVVLFISHLYKKEIEDYYFEIKSQLPENYRLVFCLSDECDKYDYYYESEKNNPNFNLIDFYHYDNSLVNIGFDEEVNFGWVNPERVLENFYLDVDNSYDDYYVIEFDVYTKNWRVIFDRIENSKLSKSDLLACNLYINDINSGWAFYKKHKKHNHEDDRTIISSSLSFIKISNRGLKLIVDSLGNDKITENIAELYYPTLIYNNNLILQSFTKDDFFSGIEMARHDTFSTEILFLNKEICHEEGVIYTRCKDCFERRLLTVDDIFYTCNKYISFSYTKNNSECDVIIDKLIQFDFKTFEIYNKNRFYAYANKFDVRKILSDIDFECIVKASVNEYKPFGAVLNGFVVNIMHYNGYANNLFDLNLINTNKLFVPENLTLITVESNESKSPLIKQLVNSGINFVNGCSDDIGIDRLNSYNLTLKIDYINNALQKVHTDYTLFLDSRDVVIFYLDDIIDKFEGYGCDLLFGSDPGPYPKNYSTKIETERYVSGIPNCINSGAIIGKTATMKEIFGKLTELRKLFGIEKTVGVFWDTKMDAGDQGFIRKFADTFNCWYRRNVIDFDYKEIVFPSVLNRPMCITNENSILARNNY